MAMTADSSSEFPYKNVPWDSPALWESSSTSGGDQIPSLSAFSYSPLNHSVTESASSTAERSDDGDNAAAQTNGPAWNNPSNDAVEVAPVIDAASWPALGESARASSSAPSSRAIPNGSSSSAQGPSTSIRDSAQTQAYANANPNSLPRPTVQSQPRRGGGGGRPMVRGFTQPPPFPPPPPPPPPYPGFPFPLLPVTFPGFALPMPPLGPYVPQPYGGGNSYRRGGYPGNGRGRGPPGGFLRPFNAPPFGPPPPPLPYGPDANHSIPFHGYGQQRPVAPFLPSLPARIVTQINYYFSDANLETDGYLKSLMDEHGWVSVHEIKKFYRLKQLTEDVRLILNSMRSSADVEVQGERLRKRHNWMRWLMPRRRDAQASSSSQTIENSVKQLKIEDAAIENSSELQTLSAANEDASQHSGHSVLQQNRSLP